MSKADKIMEAATALVSASMHYDPVQPERLHAATESLRETIEWALLEAYAEGRKDERAENFPGVDIDAVHRRADLVRQQGTGDA